MKKTNPNFEIKKTSNTLKADRAIHRVTFNPNRASSAEVLRVPVPKHNNRDALVPGPFQPIFDSAVCGHANGYIVNNVSRALVGSLTVKFAEMIAQDNDVYDLYKFFEDLGSDKTQLAYELNKISLSMKSFAVKNSLMRPCLTTKIGKRFMCEHVTQDNLSR